MKRGLITWDRETLPPSAFDARLARARQVLKKRKLDALIVYSDVWRSNQARYLTNFMPYWNRSLAVIPREGDPVLLCGLSPRVYPWIRSVTVFGDIRPASKMIPALEQLCTESEWNKLGILDQQSFPEEFNAPLKKTKLKVTNIPAADVLDQAVDDAEIAMRKKAAALARGILRDELPHGVSLTGHQFAGRLERAFRRAGAEDLLILISTGASVPAPPTAAPMGGHYSVAIAMELSGHWIKIARAHGAPESLWKAFYSVLEDTVPSDIRVEYEDLSGPYPWQATNRLDLSLSRIYAIHVEQTAGDRRFFHGDTCLGGQTL